MVLLERYLELRERETGLVSPTWKAYQIVCYIAVSISGIFSCYMFSRALQDFDNNCMLFGNVSFTSDSNQPAENSSEYVYVIDIIKTEWGKSYICEFCQFVPVCSVICGIVWGTFFTMCGRGGKTTRGLSQPWRIVFPALMFNIFFCLVSLISSIRINMGFDDFCSKFKINMNENSCVQGEKYRLSGDVLAQVASRRIHAAIIFSWLNTVSWLLSVIVLIIRCCCTPDFDIVMISVITPTPEEPNQVSQRRSRDALQFEQEMHTINLTERPETPTIDSPLVSTTVLQYGNTVITPAIPASSSPHTLQLP